MDGGESTQSQLVEIEKSVDAADEERAQEGVHDENVEPEAPSGTTTR